MLMKGTMAIIDQWTIPINFRGGATDLTFRFLCTRSKVNTYVFAYNAGR